ncbi:MAG: UDP-N-acetylmuramoyl-L-alanyl-D-glutamate--2,6-diaminopimelate ligase [Oscillospiraceae bacterium]|nr:UDP-N-acetylmuramoyl-L-alanyl-D-glutamate--2,6-diaminopimelate ligase [Oscillospiraceae bacterium]
MKLSEILKDVPVAEWHADPDMEITGVEADSRRVKPGCLFVAVVGYESDGHSYIPSAMEKGAACVLCSRAPEKDIPYVLTENTRRGLALTAANRYGRPAEKMKIVGVTGTNGKTTTTNLIKTILEKTTGRTVGLVGTNGNYIGSTPLPAERTTPESNELQELFARMADAGCSFVVMEVSSHALFLDRVYGVPFEVGVFTNLTEDHLDFHRTMEEYGKAKAILFSMCRRGSVNADDPAWKVMAENASCPLTRTGAAGGDYDMWAEDVSLHDSGVDFTFRCGEGAWPAHLGIPGRFSVYNALSALSAVVLLGVDPGAAVEALGECAGVMGRAEVVPGGKGYTMLIDYAHTPDAMENIIRTVRGFARGRVVTLFGCGGDRDRTKRPIMGRIAADLSDFVIVTSDNPRTEQPDAIIRDILAGMTHTSTPYVVIENRREAIFWAVAHAQPGDVVIFAGKGHETYQIIGKTKNHFDEREVIRDALAALERKEGNDA